MKATVFGRNLVVALTMLFIGVLAVPSNGYDITIDDDYSFPQRNDYDYGLMPADIHFNNNSPSVGEVVTITAQVHNHGLCMATSGWGWYSSNGRSCWGEWDFDYPASGTVDISFRSRDDVIVDWRVELDGVHLASPSVPGSGDAGFWKILTIHDVPINAGSHTIFLGTYQMDYYPDYHLDWIQVGAVHMEAENYDRMGGNDPNADLRGLRINPQGVNPPSSNNLTVQMWDGDPSAGGSLICESFLGVTNTVIDAGHNYPENTIQAHYIENNGQGSLVCEWTPTEPGNHEIYLVVDPHEVLTEIDEMNNFALRDINVSSVEIQPPTAIISSISPNPAANYQGNKLEVVYQGYGSAHDVIQFDAAGSFDPDGGSIIDYIWSFNGNVYSHASSFQRSDLLPGTYAVSLTVVDDEGQSSTPVEQILKVIDGLVFRPPFGGDIVLDGTMIYDSVCYWGAQGEVENEPFRNESTGFIGAYSEVHPPLTGFAHSATAGAGQYIVFKAPDGQVRVTAEVLTLGGKSTDLNGNAYTKWWFGHIYHDLPPVSNWTNPQDPWNWLYTLPTSDWGYFDHWLDWTVLPKVFLSYLTLLIPEWTWVEHLFLEGLIALVDYLDIDELLLGYLNSGEGNFDRQVLSYNVPIRAQFNAIGYFVETYAGAFWTLSSGKAERNATVSYISVEESETAAPPSLVICGLSPIDLIVVDPLGDTLSKGRSDVPNSKYLEVNIDRDGRIDDYVRIDSAASGEYLVTVFVDSTADTLQSTYSVVVAYQDTTFYLARDVSISQIPITPYSFWTIPVGSISGTVSDSLGGLLGVNVDIYDSTGNLWMSVVTDDSGYYHIDSIPNGNYTATVVTPLGYQADQETQEFTIHHVPVRVDFSLTKLDITPGPRSRAYWAHQLFRAFIHWSKDYSLDDFSNFAGLINVHFNQNQVNPVDFYSVQQPADQADSLRILKKLLHMRNTGDWEPFFKRLAKAQLMALMLNVVSGKVSQTQEISRDGRTVSQAITYCDMLVNDEIDCPDNVPGHGSPLCRYILADFILTFANLGLPVPQGFIPEDVVEIAYRIHDQDNLPDGFALSQNYPNPFNPTCEIEYALSYDCQVSLTIYNLLGQRVRVLVDEYQTAGNKFVRWNGRDDQDQEVTSGVYFYRLNAAEFTETKKMLLVK